MNYFTPKLELLVNDDFMRLESFFFHIQFLIFVMVDWNPLEFEIWGNWQCPFQSVHFGFQKNLFGF
jgi:hypothetical protein